MHLLINFCLRFTDNKKSNQGNKPNRINISKANMQHISPSLGGEVKLRESENALKPTRLKAISDLPEEESVTQTLYKKVRGVLNKVTPQKFDTLVKQVKSLAIDTQDMMDGQKAVAENGAKVD